MPIDTQGQYDLDDAADLLEEQVRVVVAMLAEPPFKHLNGSAEAGTIVGLVKALAINNLAVVARAKG